MKSKLQIAIVSLSFAALVYSATRMLETPTMILPSWIITLLFTAVTVGVSFWLGYLVQQILRSGWHVASFSAVFILIFSAAYAVFEYKPTYKYHVDPNYMGIVKLFVSNDQQRDLKINSYGVGYISRRDFDNGFRPRVFKNEREITREISSFGVGSAGATGNQHYSFKYLFFTIPASKKTQDLSVEELIAAGALDTLRLYKKP